MKKAQSSGSPPHHSGARMFAKIRLSTQLLFLAFSISLYLGAIASRPLVSFYNSMHLFPSLSSLAGLVLPPCITATLLFLLLPLLIGRLYCAHLCPVGFFQDIIGRFTNAIHVNRRSTLSFHPLRLLILFFALTLLFLGSSFYHYVDHFSNLGRVYGVFQSVFSSSSLNSNVMVGAAFLVIITAASFVMPRWYCNVICPSGTLLMFLQRISIFRIAISDHCKDCGLCTPTCPVLCIHDRTLDRDLCIHCFECIDACPRKAISLSFVNPLKKARPSIDQHHPDKRRFLLAVAASVFGISIASALKKTALTFASITAKTVIPPGGKSAVQFLSKCTACNACVSICPTRVLVPSGFENSLLGFQKIKMDFDKANCSYECNACLSVCPTGAISYFPLELKQKIKIGSSKLDKEKCIPYAQEKDCAACHEQCPTGAITMEKYKSVYGPVINQDYCIGCGSCQYACPVLPARAILVTPEETHRLAYTPKEPGPGAKKKPGSKRKPSNTEFPF